VTTPTLHTLLPVERAVLVDRLEDQLDVRLEQLVATYEQSWAGQRPLVREWLREVLDYVLFYVRDDVLRLVRDLVAIEQVH
jgi:hypothetical protein